MTQCNANSTKSQSRKVVLKPGREKSLKRRHPWIFSGAIQSYPSFTDGDVLDVVSSEHEFLGKGYFSKRTQIVGRMLTFCDIAYEDAVRKNIASAGALRSSLIDPSYTNAYRVINAEQDSLPGLIVDKYANTLVIQISTLGMQKLKPLILECLIEYFSPESIYEKSQSSSRNEEGLAPFDGTVWGAPITQVQIYEGPAKLVVDFKGQKTGFFLDQREMRSLVRSLAKGRRVLNCFSYTGAFSLHALLGGASYCESVDISKDATQLCSTMMELNGIESSRHLEVSDDVFEYLRNNELNFTLAILDPPAFAKKKSDVIKASRGYKDINRLAMKKLPPQSLLITSSCSHYIDEKLFEQIIFSAACEAGRNVRIVQKHRLAFDHPISVFHPEGSYLKTLVCYIE